MSNGDRNDDHQGDGSGQGRASLLIHADLTSTPAASRPGVANQRYGGRYRSKLQTVQF